MKRRDFIALVVSGWWHGRSPRAQRMPVIGYLSSGSLSGFATRLAAFRRGLQEASRPPRRSALPFRPPCSRAPTR
jgi:hypothetical protein